MAGNILSEDEVGIKNIGIVGGKGAHLGDLSKVHGVLVPRFFCITTEAYRKCVGPELSSIRRLVEEVAEKGGKEATQEIESYFEKLHIPHEIKDEILEAYTRLGKGVAVSVRSSATSEDRPDASFAGQLVTVLNVLGDQAIISAVKKCWASLWDTRVLQYSQTFGIPHQDISVAVVVQEMVDAKVSGVLFSANPMNRRSDEMLIESTFGLGEALVSGLATPDTFVVERPKGKVLWYSLGPKEVTISCSIEGKVLKGQTPTKTRRKLSLRESDIRELVKIGVRIESKFRSPQDIEWAYDDKRNLYILQSRPITTLQGPRVKKDSLLPDYKEKDIWSAAPLDERILWPMTPWSQGLMDRTHLHLIDTVRSFGIAVPQGAEMVKVFYGRPYVNKSLLDSILGDIPGASDMVVLSGHTRRLRIHLHGSPEAFVIGLNVLPLLFTVRKRWEQYLEYLEEAVSNLKREDIKKVSKERLLYRLHVLEGLTLDSAKVHFQSQVLAQMLYNALDIFIEKTLFFGPDRRTIICTNLVSGLRGNKTVETNIALWRLSQEVCRDGYIRQIFLSNKPDDTLRALKEDRKASKEFIPKLERFLKRYGHRSPVHNFLSPSWFEEPANVFNLIGNYILAPEGFDPVSQRARISRLRKDAEEEVETALKKGVRRIFPLRLMVFRILLGMTRHYMLLRENQQFFVGKCFPLVRMTLLELGNRYVREGLIERPDDVLFFTTTEFKRIESKDYQPEMVRELYEKRRAKWKLFDSITPPQFIGGIGGSTASITWEPTDRGKYVSDDAIMVLEGVGGSGGRISGIARVINGPQDFNSLQEGEIIVAPSTNPAWTPLFVTAKGVVTDIGGLLSHGAVVAREYGIPAVLGTGDATKKIKTGQRILVDGNLGRVHILR